MTGATIDLPPLATLELKPTWVNRSGRVDRTACVEIRAGELWPHATFREVKRHRKSGEASYLEAVSTITLAARFLHKLHVDRNPLTLQGDWRTSKANALKSPGRGHSPVDLKTGRPEGQSAKPAGLQASKPAPPRGGTDERYPFDVAAQRRAYEKYDGVFVRDHPLPAGNPNRGAPFTGSGKQIGLRADWTQEISIERWRLHEKLAKHFLVCPGTGLPLPLGEGEGEGQSEFTCSSNRFRGCCRKAAKLFTPVCSIQESNDSELAEGWVKMVDARYTAACRPMPPTVIEMRHRLLERYGLLFRGRRLVCRGCLGVRYGEVKSRKLKFES